MSVTITKALIMRSRKRNQNQYRAKKFEALFPNGVTFVSEEELIPFFEAHGESFGPSLLRTKEAQREYYRIWSDSTQTIDNALKRGQEAYDAAIAKALREYDQSPAKTTEAEDAEYRRIVNKANGERARIVTPSLDYHDRLMAKTWARLFWAENAPSDS
jgi:hypothetical protein